MGNIIRTAQVIAVDAEGNAVGRPRRLRALLDTGATATVISRRLAKSLGGHAMGEGYSFLEGKPVGAKVIRIHVAGRNCPPQVIVAMVDDEAARRARPGATIIVGHDYLQRSLCRLRYDTDPHEMDCGQVLVRRSRPRRPSKRR